MSAEVCGQQMRHATHVGIIVMLWICHTPNLPHALPVVAQFVSQTFAHADPSNDTTQAKHH
jgi:hypothetical protein